MRIHRFSFAPQRLRWAFVWGSLALLLLHCAGNAPPLSDPTTPDDFATPPFYRIDGRAGGTILLMGTVHLGPPGGWQFSPALLEGLDRADRFVLEIDLRSLTEDAVATLLAEIAVIPPPNSLLDLVSAETARLLDEKDAQLAKMGMPRNARKWFKPWFIVISLLESTSAQSDFDAKFSAENTILEASGSRPLIGLETLAEQLGFFNDLSFRLQEVLLQDALIGLDTATEELNALVNAWRRGDEAELEAVRREGVDESPELESIYDILIRDRNRRWMPVFEKLLNDPKFSGETTFVGVGALHLVGEDGLIQLFREAGYDAFPIGPAARRQ